MKKCPYCGKNYSDDTLLCAIDRYQLVSSSAPAQEKSNQFNTDPFPPTFPEREWTQRDAWKCITLIICCEIILAAVFISLRRHYSGFSFWEKSGFGNLLKKLIFNSAWVFAAACFARAETLSSFYKKFGLDRGLSKYALTGVLSALAIRIFGQMMIIHGWGRGVANYEIRAFRNSQGFERYLFLVPLVLVAPLFEEAVNRGFLYKAFRGSYSLQSSMAFIVAWTAFTHWNQYSYTWIAVFDLSLLTVIQCYLREKSGSLWDCILCHFAFNASSLVF